MATSQMSNPRELFLHELGDVLYAEQTLVTALPKPKDEASDEELAKGFGDHLEETSSTSRIQARVQELGERARRRSAPGSKGTTRNTTSLANGSPPLRYSTRS